MIKVIAATFITTLVIYGVWYCSNSILSNSERVTVTEPVSSVVAAPSELHIKRLHIKAPIAGAVGLQDTGELELPVSTSSVFYYQHTAVPGLPGSAVLLGYGEKNGSRAVFANLSRLREGDTIMLVDTAKAAHTFAITDVELLESGLLPFEKIFSKEAAPALRLIDCYETMIESTSHCTHQVVVYASLVAVDQGYQE